MKVQDLTVPRYFDIDIKLNHKDMELPNIDNAQQWADIILKEIEYASRRGQLGRYNQLIDTLKYLGKFDQDMIDYKLLLVADPPKPRGADISDNAERIADFKREFLSGTTCGHFKKTIHWVSPSSRFIVVTKHGHTSYVDRFTKSVYCPTFTALIDTLSKASIQSQRSDGMILSHEGKLTKTVLQSMIDKANELES